MKVFSTWKRFYWLSVKAPKALSHKEIDRLRAIDLFEEKRDINPNLSLEKNFLMTAIRKNGT